MAEQEYIVRFGLRVKAGSPGDAVDGVVDLFVEKGLRDWVYRVEDPNAEGDAKLVGFFDGYGDPVDVDALLAAPDAAPTEEIPAVQQEITPPSDEPADAELLAEAASLNQSGE